MTETLSAPTPLLRDYMGTEWANGEPSFLFELRLTRCYELSAIAVMGDLGDGYVVHGSMHGRMPGNRRIGHGWVLLNTEPGEPEQIWEPILGGVFLKDEWYEFARLLEERRYDGEQTRIEFLRSGHYGRWHRSRWP